MRWQGKCDKKAQMFVQQVRLSLFVTHDGVNWHGFVLRKEMNTRTFYYAVWDAQHTFFLELSLSTWRRLLFTFRYMSAEGSSTGGLGGGNAGGGGGRVLGGGGGGGGKAGGGGSGSLTRLLSPFCDPEVSGSSMSI